MYIKHKMDFQDYLMELLGYSLFALVCSFGLYYIGLVFVGRLLQPVSDNMDDMQNFIHNAGHELKTPLAAIDSNLQILSGTQHPDRPLVLESRQELSRLNHLVESLIDLADISQTAPVQNIDVHTEIKAIVGEYQTLIQEQDITVHIDFQKPLVVVANPGYMQIFLSNFIENAIKYNTGSGSVHVSYNGDMLSISDTGIGMTRLQQSKIFDRFYRAHEHQAVSGFGIGLSLVYKIAHIYAWKISVESESGKGSQFDIEFKK